jgi:pimeloyl-ACP methyl ester carboxylesterase
MTRSAKLVGGLVAAIVIVAAIAYVARDQERATLDDAARATASGKFVRLRDGVTHYELTGPDSARTIVLFSGATVPYYLWDPTRDALVANGFRVLRYDYYGRGYSDRPALQYDLAMYDRQITELLDSLRIRGPVDAAGISMGGVIAASFADRHPDRVRSLTLMDPAFGNTASLPFALRAPGVGEYLMTTMGAPTMAKGQLDDFLHPERHPEWPGRYEPQMRYKGFRHAILETRRGDVMRRPASTFTTLASDTTPILLIWGKSDRTVPFARSDTVRAAFARAEFHAVDSAAHLPNIEQPAAVDSILVRFLRAH